MWNHKETNERRHCCKSASFDKSLKQNADKSLFWSFPVVNMSSIVDGGLIRIPRSVEIQDWFGKKVFTPSMAVELTQLQLRFHLKKSVNNTFSNRSGICDYYEAPEMFCELWDFPWLSFSMGTRWWLIWILFFFKATNVLVERWSPLS